MCATNAPVGYNDSTFEVKKQENFGEKIAKCVKTHTFGTAYKNCDHPEGILPKVRRRRTERFTSICGNATISLYAAATEKALDGTKRDTNCKNKIE